MVGGGDDAGEQVDTSRMIGVGQALQRITPKRLDGLGQNNVRECSLCAGEARQPMQTIPGTTLGIPVCRAADGDAAHGAD